MIEDISRANEVILKLKKALNEKNKESLQAHNDYVYLLADFENFKKRSEAMLNECKEEGKADVILKLSETINELFYFRDVVFKSLGQENDIAKGFSIIIEKLQKSLSDSGFLLIDPLNQNFDPRYHHIAYTQKVENDALKGKVIKVLSKGYMQNGKVIKPAVVVVGV
ncbi:MAG: nucleotide exchange factor GrpE [Nitrososphaeria archaeon]|nr:nucleotide exchange factor GrpE [Conexivisphaerales archaeon]